MTAESEQKRYSREAMRGRVVNLLDVGEPISHADCIETSRMMDQLLADNDRLTQDSAEHAALAKRHVEVLNFYASAQATIDELRKQLAEADAMVNHLTGPVPTAESCETPYAQARGEKRLAIIAKIRKRHASRHSAPQDATSSGKDA
jgi:hypothetical protein